MPATKSRESIFFARVGEQRLVMEPGAPIFDGGRVIGTTPSRVIQFTNGSYRTADPEEIDFIRSRIPFVDGLSEMDAAALAPSAEGVLAELVTANAEDTRQILEDELENWNRPVVVETCERKLAAFATRGPKTKTD